MKNFILSFFVAFLGFISSLYAQNDCPVWEWADNIKPPQDFIEILKMQSDSIGNQYVMGKFIDTLRLDSNTLYSNSSLGSFFIAKRNRLHAWEWASPIHVGLFCNGSTSSEMLMDFYLDGAGQITVTGQFCDTAKFGSINIVSDSSIASLFVARFDTASQQWLWASKVNSSLVSKGQAVVTDNSGNAYILGDIIHYLASGPVDVGFGPINFQVDSSTSFLAKIDLNGNWLWVRSAGQVHYWAGDVTIDTTGNPILANYFKNNISIGGLSATFASPNSNIFIAKLSPAGQALWLKISTDTSQIGHYHYIESIDIDASDNVYLSGTSSGIQFGNHHLFNGFNQGGNFVVKLSNAGQWKWATEVVSDFGSIYNSHKGHSLTTKTGDSYMVSAGHNWQNIIFGTDTLQTRGWSRDIVITKIDSAGNRKWIGHAWDLPTYQVSKSRNPYSLSADELDNIYITGPAYNAIQFGKFTTPHSSYFLAKIRPDSTLFIDLPKDTTLFCGDSLTLLPITSSVAQLNAQWTPAHGLSDPNSITPRAAPDSTTTYTLNVTTAGGCSAMAQITIARDSSAGYNRGLGILTSTGGTTFCDNVPITLSTFNSYNKYIWSTGDTTTTITIEDPGKYSLTIIDSNGCYISGDIDITPPVKIVSSSLLLCTNDSISLSINPTGLDSIIWSNGSPDQQIYATQPGTYWVTVQKGSCQFTDTVELIAFNDTANASFSYNSNGLTVNFQPTSIGVSKGVWHFGDGNFVNSVNSTHTYASPGTYQVCYEATDVCGYTAMECDSITVALVNLPEPDPLPMFSLYPNPTTGNLTIESSGYGNHSLIVTDVSGKTLLYKTLEQGNTWEIDLSHLPQGYYFISIDNHTSRLMKF